jgi:cytochrome c553
MAGLLVVATSISTIALLAGLRRTKTTYLKSLRTVLSAAFLTVAFLIGILITVGLFRLNDRAAPIPATSVARTPEQVVLGQAISNVFCNDCHIAAAPVAGDFYVARGFPVRIGSFISSNLTPAGDLSRWSDGEIFRAIRNSIDRDGRWLIIMSYTNARKLSDDDTRAVIAYLRSLPPAGRSTEGPPDRLSLLGVMMLGADMFPRGWPVSAGVISAPPKGPTVQYGEYLLSYQDCRTCHGNKLTGGVPGQAAPLGPDLSLIKGWNPEEFVAAMRTGVDPKGHELTRQMPRLLAKMDDEDLVAIYEYLTHMPSSED